MPSVTLMAVSLSIVTDGGVANAGGSKESFMNSFLWRVTNSFSDHLLKVLKRGKKRKSAE
jgi:hypothetical protein